jgi:hypothetical protein
MAPLLMINPGSDAEFSRIAQELVDGGTTTPDELESALRVSYPLAVVRGSYLSGESRPTWYVYREGHWVQRD